MKSGLSWLDVKLGVRMLFKHPGLTLVGGLGMALAIGVGAGMFAFMYSFMFPRLPLDEGHRIVAIENRDIRRDREDRRSLHDLATWRAELRTVREVSAYRDVNRNHIAPDGSTIPVRLAEMTASGFRVARVAPQMGRPLLDEDEKPGAPPVVVIGHDVWRTRFAGDPAIIGRQVRLGNGVHTVVGVMPRGYAFPVNHGWWIPFRLSPLDHARGTGPELYVFGRLAPGATREQAQAELDAVGQRTAAAYPRTHASLRPAVMNYTDPAGGVQDVSVWEMSLIQGMISLLLVVVAVNVAILVYARTSMRLGEIAIRTALGASRRRIVGQLFVEALVLSGLSALVGLGIAQAGLRLVQLIHQLDGGGELPFWMRQRIPAATVAYAVAMAVLAAVIAGVLPALGVTGRRMQDSLRQLGGGTGLQLGRTWTVLIVAQVGFAVAAIPIALGVTIEEVGEVLIRPRFDPDAYLFASVGADLEPPAGLDPAAYRRELHGRFAVLQGELVRRLRAEPWAESVTVGSGVPSLSSWSAVQMDAPARPPQGGSSTSVTDVDSGYFATYGATLLAGRLLGAADVDTASTAVVVNQAFARRFVGEGSALGRRVRYELDVEPEDPAQRAPERWYTIVGVVSDFHENRIDPTLTQPALYHPWVPGESTRLSLSVRVRGDDAARYLDRMREVAAAVDPTLRVSGRPLAEVYRQADLAIGTLVLVLGLVVLSVLGLSAAGIYALMSFTVSQRRKEIGIRAALGADPRALLGSIFSRALRQLGIGLGLGLLVAGLLEVGTGGEVMYGKGLILLPAVCVLMLGAGMLATLGPARRGLRIQPMEALREE